MIETNCSVTVMPVYSGYIGFIRRDPGDTFGGMLVAPGGKVEVTDGQLVDNVPYHSVEAAAIREMWEETGITISRDQLEYFCSLTLPSNGRVVISLYCDVTKEQLDRSNKLLVLLDREAVKARNDFAPGMKEEALMLFGILREKGVA